mgnify:CR=1 FL=1
MNGAAETSPQAKEPPARNEERRLGARGERPDWIEPIQAATNVRSREGALHCGVTVARIAKLGVVHGAHFAAPARVRFVRRADLPRVGLLRDE